MDLQAILAAPSYLIAFIGGLILFASPCVAPLIPAYMASISGGRLSEIAETPRRELQRLIFRNAIVFILGFSIVFILLGMFVGYLSQQIAGFQIYLNRIGGGFIIILAFHMLGLIKIPLLDRETTIGTPENIHGSLRTAFMGVSFGITWTPCTGPILAGILALSATSASLVASAALMTAFSLGLAVPFLITGLFTVHVARFLSGHPRLLTAMSFVGGLFLLVLGVLIFSGRLQWLMGQFYSLF